MSQLEEAVRENLIALARDERCLGDLGSPAHQTLARWATKTAFAAQSIALGPKLIPREHRYALAQGDLGEIHVVGRQCTVDLGLGTFGTQNWLVSHSINRRDEVEDAVSHSYKLILTIGRLVLSAFFWPDPNSAVAISQRSHTPIWPTASRWMTYPYATDRHSVAPTTATEIIDMAVGIRVAHSGSRDDFASVPVEQFG